MTPTAHDGKVTGAKKADKSKKVKLPGNVSGTIRERGNRWQADLGEVNGRRKRKSCKSLTEAQDWLREQALLLQNQGEAAFSLTDAQRLDAVRALEILKPFGLTMESVAKTYAENNSQNLQIVTVKDAIDRYLEDLTKDLRPRSLADMRSRLSRFCIRYGDKKMNQITGDHARQWITGIHQKPLSVKHFFAVCHAFFNWAIDRQFTNVNPFDLIKPRHRRRGGASGNEEMPECLRWKQVQKLMQIVEKDYPELVPAFAIGFFAGLRPEELGSLDWRNVNLTDGHISVMPEVAKTRRTRNVMIEDNLKAWLAPYRKESGLVRPVKTTWRGRFDQIREKAGLFGVDASGKELWPHDAMRHTYASHHYVKYQDAGKTAAELGHIGTGMLFQHYRAMVTDAEAAQYWQIRPDSKANVIPFRKEA